MADVKKYIGTQQWRSQEFSMGGGGALNIY